MRACPSLYASLVGRQRHATSQQERKHLSLTEPAGATPDRGPVANGMRVTQVGTGGEGPEGGARRRVMG